MKHESKSTYLLSEEEEWTAYLLCMLADGWVIVDQWRKGDTFTVKFER